MQFSIATVLALATAVAALPPAAGTGAGQQVGHAKNKFELPENLTTKQAAEKCGSNAELKCCNKEVKTGDFTKVEEGLLNGLLENLIGGGQGSEGAAILDQCTNIPVNVLDSEYLPTLAMIKNILTKFSSHRPASEAVQPAHFLLPEHQVQRRKYLNHTVYMILTN